MNKDINTSVRNKELRFYKEDGEWYADVAEHTQAENRMVAGADALIESFARGGNEVRIVLSADVDDPNPYQIKLKRIEHDAWGATYLAHIKGFLLPRPAWLCNVTHTVFGGEHPRTIYIHSVAA
ncbi:MAG: DUF6717 family protein [Kiritimatiellia bacterium]|nr:DUF6717 family protein [Kiritimatiellia bacterium]